ncbi:MAG TPA: hypothetical protein VFE62_24665 [Gemmataceae bacterium]|nr:hypothetical protein [Gemmataceae bacterium]
MAPANLISPDGAGQELAQRIRLAANAPGDVGALEGHTLVVLAFAIRTGGPY